MRRRSKAFRGLGLVFLVLGVAVAAVGVVSANPGFPFNSNPFLSRKENDATEASQYYGASGINAPTTLAAWKALYFPSSGGTRRASANYYNAGDLGFGREMHCYEENDFTACYVVNHGLGAGAPAEISVQDVVADTRRLPTVAMVFDYATYQATPPNNANAVRFYVYGTDGNLLNQVGLDSEGDKSVPGLCLACHGGTYNAATNAVSDANFLPWDIDSFAYSPTAGSTKADQLAQFKVLNEMVRNSFPDAKIASLIDGWYGGVNFVYNPGAVYNDSYIPPAYNGNATNQQLYTGVVKHYCRGCHMAQGFDLESPANLGVGATFNAVFVARDMPHAQLTNHRFWSSPAPAILARLYASNTFTVTKTADTADGTCNAADCSLREAIIAANSNANHSVIVFGVNGIFNLTRTGADDTALNGDLDINADLTILGNSAALTEINSAASDRVFHLRNGANVLIQNVTIEGGSADAGAGLRVVGSSLVLNFSVVRDNHATAASATAGAGSGLSSEDGAVVEINQSAFINNTGTGLGGALLNDNSIIAVYNTTLSGNAADQGGALYNDFGGSATLEHTTVVFNTATTSGGAIVTNQSSTTGIINSIISGNSAPSGSNCVIVDIDSNHESFGVNVLGENGSAGGCPTTPGTPVVPSGSVNTVVGLSLVSDPVHGVQGYLPKGPALDAIAFGLDCSTPSYDAFDVARPRDADNNGSIRCDVGAAELVTWPVYLPLIVR